MQKILFAFLCVCWHRCRQLFPASRGLSAFLSTQPWPCQPAAFPLLQGAVQRGMGQGCPCHAHGLGDASTCSGAEDWLTQQRAVREVLAAIACPALRNTCVTWLSKGPTSRQGSEVVKDVGAQLPTKKNFCLLHSPKKVSAHFTDNILTRRSIPVPPEKCSQSGL